jgi:hypothetical protein
MRIQEEARRKAEEVCTCKPVKIPVWWIHEHLKLYKIHVV